MNRMTWRKGIISDFFVLQRGFDLTNKHSSEGNIPVISSSGISYYHNEAKVKGPGVITGRKGKVGNVIYYAGDFWPHDTTLWVKDFKGNDPKFIYHFLDSMKLERYDEASSVPTLNRNNVHCVTCQFPPIEEQIEIFVIIDTWDLAIEKTEQLIAANEKGYSQFIRTMIDDNCSNWKHFRADKIFKSVSEKGNGGAELLSVTQDRGVIPRTMLEGRVMSPEGGTDGYKLIKKDDFAISLRSFQGGIEYSQYQGLISPAYTVLRAKLEIDDDFYRHFFKSYLFIEKYLSIAVIGIRDGKQISIPDFMTVKIPLPPIDQQKQIAAILNTARQEIDLLKKQAEAYRRQKRGLMQKLLAGEWRVKATEEAK